MKGVLRRVIVYRLGRLYIFRRNFVVFKELEGDVWD